MKKYSVIINLTQHKSTQEQKKAGVVDLPEKYREKLVALLTFNELPNCIEIQSRVEKIVDLVENFLLNDLSPIKDEFKEIKENDYEGADKLGLAFMVGGAPFLMTPLCEELSVLGMPLFAFSKRVVEEKVNENGEVIKVSKFKHEGFIPYCDLAGVRGIKWN